MELAIFDAELNRLEAWRAPTPKESYQSFLDSVVSMIEKADHITQVRGTVGIGLPGLVDPEGCAVSSNIPCIHGRRLKDDISARLSRPVSFENDVKAFAFSEANGGAGEEQKYVLGVVLGTGVSGGLCIDGRLYSGSRNVSEFGHLLLPAIIQQRYQFPLRVCGCGRTSCIEQYLSGPGLLGLCSHFHSRYTTVAELIQSLQRGDTQALEIFSAYVDCLGSYLAQLTLVFDPNIIVLGGGLSNIPELYQMLPGAISEYLFAGVNVPRVVAPKFGDSSGVRGVALLGHRYA